MRVRVKNPSGAICVETHTHDEAVVVSGSLLVDSGAADISTQIAKELEIIAHEVETRGGITGHIKAALTVTSTDMISVTDVKATINESPRKRALLTLTVIVFGIDRKEARDITGKALESIRSRLLVSNGACR